MKFKNLKLSTLIVHMIIGLAYPIIKVSISESNKLLIFTDSVTIISFLMIILGLFYSFSLHGDFDRTKFLFVKSVTKTLKTIDAMEADAKKERESSFNYPLFTGLLFLMIAIILNVVIVKG